MIGTIDCFESNNDDVKKLLNRVFITANLLLVKVDVPVDAALLAGVVNAKVILLKFNHPETAEEELTRQLMSKAAKGEAEQNRDALLQEDFRRICLVAGFLNCGGEKAKLVLAQCSFLRLLFVTILASCSVLSGHAYQVSQYWIRSGSNFKSKMLNPVRFSLSKLIIRFKILSTKIQSYTLQEIFRCFLFLCLFLMLLLFLVLCQGFLIYA